MNPALSKIRGWLRHPMLVAIKSGHWRIFWPMATGGTLLFGSFLAYAVYDRIAVKKRGDMGATRTDSFTRADATALGVGTIAYVAMILFASHSHPSARHRQVSHPNSAAARTLIFLQEGP